MTRSSTTLRSVAGRTLLAVTLLATVLAGTAPAVDAASAPSPAATIAGGGAQPGYQLEGFRWNRSSVPVYFNWEGGTCVFAGSNFTGPATAISQTVLLDILQASIADINLQLRGGLTLQFAGLATHNELCSTSSARPIVVGFGATPTTGQALSFGTVLGGPYTTYTAARVFVSNTTNFACTGSPPYRDLQLTMAHELLHSIGIGHSQDPSALMAPTFNACQGARVLNADDLAAIAVLYPPVLPVATATATPTPTATPTATATPTTTGTFRTAVTFSLSGQALSVFSGGTAEQLEAAALAAGATGVWVQDSSGTFRLLVVNGPTFLRDQFRAAFPAGLPSNSAVTLVR